MRVTVVGCAGSFPGPDSPASCYLIEHDDTAIVLDLGNGSLGALQRHIELSRIDAVLLTHLHVDHCIDLTSFYVFRRYHPEGGLPPIPVFGPAGTAQRMAAAYGLEDDPGMTDAFDFSPISDGNGGPAQFEIGPLRITTTPVVHPVEAYAIRVDAAGNSVVYSGDTAPTPMLIDLAHGADLALFEASYLDSRYADSGYTGEVHCEVHGDDHGDDHGDGVHLTARQAGEHAAAAGVEELVLTHLVAWNDRAASAREGSAGFGREVTLATSGLTLTLDSH